MGVRTGALVACGEAGRFRLERLSSMWSESRLRMLLALAMRPTPDGVGVNGSGFKGDVVSPFRRRLVGRGVEGASAGRESGAEGGGVADGEDVWWVCDVVGLRGYIGFCCCFGEVGDVFEVRFGCCCSWSFAFLWCRGLLRG